MIVDLSKAPTWALDQKINAIKDKLNNLAKQKAELEGSRAKVMQDYFLTEAKKKFQLKEGETYLALPKNAGKTLEVIFKEYQCKWTNTLIFVCAIVVKNQIKEIRHLNADLWTLEKQPTNNQQHLKGQK